MWALEKQIGHGDAQVSFGDGERPKYEALRKAIQEYYRDILRPLEELRESVFMVLPFDDPTKAEDSFRYLARQKRVIDDAVSLFLAEMAGPDRTREGFVNGGAESDTPDGVIQQRNFVTQLVGVERAGDVVGVGTTVALNRQSPAVKAMLDNAFSRLSENGNLRLEGVRDEIHSVLTSATDAGLGPLDTARQLSKQFDQYKRFEFERLARTEAAFAAEAGSREQYKEFGVQFVTILLAVSACPICQAWEGKLIPIEELDSQPPYHPNCCVGGTVVSGPRAVASTARWYTGDVIEIETVRGHRLTVTPNHPILIPQGWVQAHLLRQGDDVISHGGLQSRLPVHPDYDNRPSVIEEKAIALGSPFLVPPRRVKVASEDFHGDGEGSKVCIVRTNRKLRDDFEPSVMKPPHQGFLCRRHTQAALLSGQGSLAQSLERVFLSSPSFLGSRGNASPFFRRPIGSKANLDVSLCLKRDPMSLQDTPHHGTAHPEVPGKRELILAGPVAVDKIRFVNRRDFRGHVYNLQTTRGWYIANGIVSHNCLCTAIPEGAEEP